MLFDQIDLGRGLDCWNAVNLIFPRCPLWSMTAYILIVKDEHNYYHVKQRCLIWNMDWFQTVH